MLSDMSISIVVPTTLTNPACGQSFESVVRAAAAVPDSEIIVVANGPGRRHYPPILNHPAIRVTHSAVGAAAARNAGMDAARSSTILFTDDDVVVPPTWCVDMTDGLRRAGTAVVAGPCDVVPAGPVTAFLNHQRVFDSSALTADTVTYAATGNCAVDRTRTDVRFDESLQTLGEDADFGYRVRDAGGAIGWLDVPPAAQLLVETVDQITDRYHRYGRAGAALYLRGRTQHAMPYATAFYADLCAGRPDRLRRLRQFAELPDPAARSTFASLQLILEGALLLGYLDELGRQLDHGIVALDRDGLREGLRGLIDRPDQTDWTDLRPDPDRLSRPAAPVPDLRAEIGAVLSAHAPLTPGRPPAEVQRALTARVTAAEEQFTRAVRAVDELGATLRGKTQEEVARALRATGVDFGFGMLRLEELLAA
jgi:hypothetical protein